MKALALACLLMLSACGHYISACPILKSYPPETSARLADEIEALPPESVIPGIIGDYYGLRRQLEACQ